MKLSIITINYNNANGLEKTIQSVIRQNNRVFEYLVIDGNSSDHSRNIIQKYQNNIDFWISEPDNGIYHAMNKGIKNAHGEYCLFLNSGDVLYDCHVTDVFLNYPIQASYVVGNVITGQGRLWKAPTTITFAQFYYQSLAHQASFIKRENLLANPYDESLQIVSDWKYALEELILKSASYQTLDLIVAREEPAGISTGSTEKHRLERQNVLIQYFPERVLADYSSFRNYRLKPFQKMIRLLAKANMVIHRLR